MDTRMKGVFSNKTTAFIFFIFSPLIFLAFTSHAYAINTPATNLNAPINYSCSNNNSLANVEATWTPGSPLKYNESIQVGTTTDFSNCGTGSSTCVVQTGKTMYNLKTSTLYYWRVESDYTNGEIGYSQYSAFMIFANTCPALPIYASVFGPAAGTVGQPLSYTAYFSSSGNNLTSGSINWITADGSSKDNLTTQSLSGPTGNISTSWTPNAAGTYYIFVSAKTSTGSCTGDPVTQTVLPPGTTYCGGTSSIQVTVTNPTGGGGTNNPPVGYHDGVKNATCNTWGWAFDPDSSSTSINVDIYRDGPAGGGGIGINRYTANVSRPDVNTAYGITGNHGFSVTFDSSSGLLDGAPHSLYAYGIDTAGGNNPLLGSSPITIQCPAPGKIAGYKVVMPGNQPIAPAASQTVTLDGGSAITNNPYGTSYGWGTVSPGSHTVSVSVPSGWGAGYTLCYSTQINCGAPNDPNGYHSKTPTSGSSVTVNVPTGGSADLWWHYTPKPADIDRDGDIDLIDFGYWLKAFQEGGNPPFLKANGDPYFPDVLVVPSQPPNTIDLLDFGAWLNAYQAQ